MRRILVLLLCLAGSGIVHAQTDEGTTLLRYPDIHRDFVVFVYGGDIWRAPLGPGEARRLTAHEGLELFPKISPDGTQVAFSAEYTGTRQVYVMSAEGGTPRQLTFYNDVGAMPPRGGWDYWIQDWTPDGKILVRMNRTPYGPRYGTYYLVDPAGGLEQRLPLPHVGSGSVSPDGSKLAYTPIDREFRTWKRHRGGRAQDIWIYDLVHHQSERITTDPATDNFPMWVGDEIFFTSDRNYTLNLYSYDLRTRNVAQKTAFEEYDVLWPAAGPENIVFMNGGRLYHYNFLKKLVAPIEMTIGGDLPYTVPAFADVSADIASSHVSPSGRRAVFEARGDLFTVPAENGPTRNITRTQGVRERDPAWSPDGEWIAYVSDATGENELYVRRQDGTGERQLTKDSRSWQFQPVWSPDSKKLAFADQTRQLKILAVDGGNVTVVTSALADGDLNVYRWSPDGQWLVFEKSHLTRLPGIGLYSLQQDRMWMLGDGLTSDFTPAFSEDGKYLFFLSNREFQLTFSAFEFNYVYDRATRVCVAALDPAAPRLFEPKSDEETPAEKDEDEKDDDKQNDDEKPQVQIDPTGFLARTLALPAVVAGNYGGLAAAKGKVFYLRLPAGGGPGTVYQFDLDERKESEVLAGVGGFELTANGEKLFYRSGDTYGIADAKPGQSSETGKLDLSGLTMKIDPRAEWKQIYHDVWRIGRDWFYDPNMHGIDWNAMRERYGKLVPNIAHRNDLDFILGELVGELTAGHCYVQAGDAPRVERVEGGLLGCEFEADASGYYRIATIFEGENWDDTYRSPLTEPGVDVHEGDFLLAIDGAPLRTQDNPYRLLEGKGASTVTLTVNDAPRENGARKVMVRPITSEINLRYLRWIKERMRLTDELSGGRIGYIHLPDTAVDGNRMLQKMFYAQTDREALIVDDRYNGGGFIPDRMIEYLSRRTLSFWQRRDVVALRSPGFAHDGPKAMLINGYAASGGDALPYFFRESGLGPLIGTRTWGGLIGISGNPMAVDGGGVLYPVFRFYSTSGDWVVENEGVTPDFEVIDLPEQVEQGHDPTLEKAVQVLLEELERHPAGQPSSPQPPDLGRKLD